MSSTSRLVDDPTHKPLDQYWTPDALASASIARLHIHRGMGWWSKCYALEPHCGQGAWLRAMDKCVTAIDVCDIDAQWTAVAHNSSSHIGRKILGDFLTVDFEPTNAKGTGWGGYDLICGNPPFSRIARDAHGKPLLTKKGKEKFETVAHLHVERALQLLNPSGLLAFVLRLGLLGSNDRAAFWDRYPPSCVYVLRPRPSFTGGGSDSADYGLFVWDKRKEAQGNVTALGFLDWA